jgi:cell division protein FtsA
MGGKSITSDLGIVLRVTPDVAESLKLRHGNALPGDVDPDEVVQITSIGEDVAHGVTRRTVSQIIEARLKDVFEAVQSEIAAAGATNRLQAGVVLTGGGSMLNGINRAARDQLGMSARVVGPQNLGGLTDQVSTPPYAAASGLLLWGARNWTLDDDRASGRALDGLPGRLGKLFKGLMP